MQKIAKYLNKKNMIVFPFLKESGTKLTFHKADVEVLTSLKIRSYTA